MKDITAKTINNLLTPCLLVYKKELEHNIEKMQMQVEKLKVNLRPHVKTHKSVYIAKKQIEAGAKGICCATIDECRCMAEHGINDILLANEIVTHDKIRIGIEIAKKADIIFAVDNRDIADLFDVMAQEAGIVLNMMLDFDAGFGRCGIKTVDETLFIAKKIKQSKNLKLKGIMTYDGKVNYIADKKEKEQRVKDSQIKFREVIEQLIKNGMEPEIVSLAGSGSYKELSELEYVTEVQCGSYVYSDNTYRQLGLEYDNAFYVLATIIHKTGNHIVLDGGAKSFATDYGESVFMDENIELVSFSEEHINAKILDKAEDYYVGRKMIIMPGHVCSTNSKHSHFHLIDEENKVLDTIGIECRR